MSAAKHTPGPWLLDAVDTHHVTDPGIDGYHAITAGAGFFSPESKERGFHLTSYMSLADAKLMAAAPDLLEALLCAYKALDAIGDEMTVGERYTNAGQYLLDALQPARDAIAKATGAAA